MMAKQQHAYVNFPKEGFARLPQVLSVFPVSKSAWYEGIASGKYPASTKLGPNTSAWKVEEIRKLIRETGVEK